LGKHLAALEQLATKRSRLALALTFILVVVYATFICLVAFNKPLVSQLLHPGLSLGIMLGLASVIVVWATIMFYIYWSNTYYDLAISRINDMRLNKE
jgi:uncharacterized membrane protein (DUF485 family)